MIKIIKYENCKNSEILSLILHQIPFHNLIKCMRFFFLQVKTECRSMYRKSSIKSCLRYHYYLNISCHIQDRKLFLCQYSSVFLHTIKYFTR